MPQLIECVPNISEGRRTDVIDRAAEAVSSAPGVVLLDRTSDPDHNRSVLTLAGSREGLAEAIHRLYEVCIATIDLTAQRGEHPRMGAVDVVPFIPIRGATMHDCDLLARDVGQAIALDFGIPIFLYATSARDERRAMLKNIRKGGFEGMAAKMRLPDWAPDFGPSEPHPTAGVSAFGARSILIAYNIQLDTPDLNIAKSIARTVRESSGGLPGVQAMGVYLADRDQAQVSMNLLDFARTPLHVVQERVSEEAAIRGVKISSAEIIGLIPQSALVTAAAHYLQIDSFSPHLILENAIEDKTVR